jgi:hypothetical protein
VNITILISFEILMTVGLPEIAKLFLIRKKLPHCWKWWNSAFRNFLNIRISSRLSSLVGE